MNRKRKDRFKPFRIIKTVAVLLAISALLTCCGKGTETTPTPKPTGTLPSGKTPLPVETTQGPSKSETPSQTDLPLPVTMSERTFLINGSISRVFIIKADVSDERLFVTPYLSFGKIYGFETLEDMAGSTDAFAGVNAGFFFEYGRPSGLVVIDGETVSPGTGKYESMIIEDGEIKFRKIKTEVRLTLSDSSFSIDNFNLPCEEGDYAVYSSYYGNTDRLEFLRKFIVVENGRITDSGITSSPKGIPKDGYLVCIPYEAKLPDDDYGEISVLPEFKKGTSAYEGASMLVRDGISLAGDTMPWVGNLNKYDPRTCIGRLDDGSLGMVVIDGRQEGYSTGTTGRETADILIELGFTDAFMLDGGASSAMYYDGSIVNSPADMGIDRILAGSFLIYIN